MTMAEEKQGPVERVIGAGREACKTLADAQTGLYFKIKAGQTWLLNFYEEPSLVEKLWPGDDKPIEYFRFPIWGPEIDPMVWDFQRKSMYGILLRRQDSKGLNALLSVFRKGSSKDDTEYDVQFDRLLTDAEIAERQAAITERLADSPESDSEIPF